MDFISIRSCFEAFTENMAGETQLLELRRQYHCAAYNCAIAVISCSFNEPKFYLGFLFSEKPEKVLAGFYNYVQLTSALQSSFILEGCITINYTTPFTLSPWVKRNGGVF